MTQDEVLRVFRDTGALLEGHFILRSGLHSRQFFQCAQALQEMPVVEQFGAALASKARHLGARTVIAPAMGGLVIGLVAGIVCLWGVNGLKRILGADDSLDVFGVHGVGGILGALLTGSVPAKSWIIGDAERDLKAGAEAGVRGILIPSHKEQDSPLAEKVCRNFTEAVDFILASS